MSSVAVCVSSLSIDMPANDACELLSSSVPQLYDHHKSEAAAASGKKTLMPRQQSAAAADEQRAASNQLREGSTGDGDNDDNNSSGVDADIAAAATGLDCAPFDIILCDYCDAELYSEQAYKVSDLMGDWANTQVVRELSARI